MIIEELKRIVLEENQKDSDPLFTTNLLKEYLQIYVLYFIFTSTKFKNQLIFTGGTCLRHFFNLGRLSVDIDFDFNKEIDTQDLKEELLKFFKIKYKYNDVLASIKNQSKQIILKFPVLKLLNLARHGQSDLLYVKIDLESNPSPHYAVVTTSKSKFGFNFAAKHFDLPSLMAGKIHAVLMREHRKTKENRETVKGRDYFDLLWFLKNGIKPNLKRLSDMLNEKIELTEVERRLDQEVKLCSKKFKSDFESDLMPLVRNREIIHDYVGHYEEEYFRNKLNSFSHTIRLEIECRHCKKIFSSGIQINKTTFEKMSLTRNTHVCPHCHKDNLVDKTAYIITE